jgi:molecular chaperone GrpE
MEEKIEKKKQAEKDKDREENSQDLIQEPSEREDVKKKAEEYASLWDKYLRICADFENARKRWDKERNDLIKFASYNLMRELVTILDELEQALRAIEKHSDNKEIAKGVALIYNNLILLTKKEGIMRIEAQGKKFDPHLHEIVGQHQVGEDKEHVVLEEVQKGYMLGDKVLRTSKVIVGVVKQSKLEAQCNDNGEGKEEEPGV